MTTAWISLITFLVCYVLLVVFPRRRSVVACACALLVVVTGAVGWHEALVEHINWNVVALFFGTLVLADLFMMSRVPAVLAERFVNVTGTVRGAMLALCFLSGLISIFVENVAVVLLVAPVALSMAYKLKISPVRLLLLIAMCSNIQGTATMIGDPPSMILAGFMRMQFNDFFVYQGRLSIFFAVEAGALAAGVVMYFLLRRYRQATGEVQAETVRAWMPSVLLTLLVTGLALASSVDPEFRWFAGALTLILAAAGLVWYRWVSRWGSVRTLVRSLDWDTTFFLIGIFVVVGAVSTSGWLDRVAAGIASMAGSRIWVAFVLLVLVSMVLSGFVDNVPFLLVMLPVVQKVAVQMGVPVPLLMFGLLAGTCMGGNLTPIGASANVVTLGILRREGHVVSFREYLRIGIPVTLVSTAVTAGFVWWIWHTA
ncbi:MAG: hypothetical protein A2340_15750 [Lentisphaerae bacterium RIFOXYB12_FULL_60_10]|nr:MAG: hypothetical protein A2340_15750 [Lentisphaerae bacterium RIFOXYB12_FULL_60_10]